MQVRLFGGGVLIFDEFGLLKYHIHNAVLNPVRQTERLRHLFGAGLFERQAIVPNFEARHLSGLHPTEPATGKENTRWR